MSNTIQIPDGLVLTSEQRAQTIIPLAELMPKPLIDKLIKLAKKEASWGEEDFCAMDCAGGNFDDAWQGGIDDGETFLAQEILDELGIKF